MITAPHSAVGKTERSGSRSRRGSQSEHLTDDEIEHRIHQEALILHTAEKREERVAAMEELRRLNAMRSPERVRQMEEKRGLR